MLSYQYVHLSNFVEHVYVAQKMNNEDVEKKEIISLVEEYMQRKTPEARLVKVADNLDALAQAKGVPGAASALKYFKEVYHITKIPWHKEAVEMILKDQVEPERSWQKK